MSGFFLSIIAQFIQKIIHLIYRNLQNRQIEALALNNLENIRHHQLLLSLLSV